MSIPSRYYIALLWISLFTYRPAFTDNAELCTPEIPFKVITYNIQFLPAPANIRNKRSQPEYRANHIGEEMSRYHLVALQEAFHAHHRGIVLDTLKKRWGSDMNSFVSPQHEDHFTNGGCVLATHLPLLKTKAVIFEAFSTPAEFGFKADGWAAKGVVWGRILTDPEKPGTAIDVYVTHLEARSGHFRNEQYKEVTRFISSTNDERTPFILLGDLNTDGGRDSRADQGSQYNALMSGLQELCIEGEIIDVWPHLRPGELGGTTDQRSDEIGRRIDYIIVGNPPKPGARLHPIAAEIRTFQDQRVFALSDHNAVEASFVWVK